MKIIKLLSVLPCSLLLGLSLSACTESSNSADQVEQTTTETSKPNKFAMAAALKIRAANPGMTESQANCVVEKMTANGQIGLGEINQMKLTANTINNNSSAVLSAYQKAVKNCQS